MLGMALVQFRGRLRGVPIPDRSEHKPLRRQEQRSFEYETPEELFAAPQEIAYEDRCRIADVISDTYWHGTDDRTFDYSFTAALSGGYFPIHLRDMQDVA
jgi:hypothetical protein